MRIDRLRIADYKNLQDFEIDFDEVESTTVLLGRNGSGKSYLLEAIVEIFRDLELGNQPVFAYDIEYLCRGHAIRISADPNRATRRLTITVDGKPLSLAAFQREANDYLPSYVFAYYSGWSSRLERQFSESTRRHYRDVLNSSDSNMPLRRLFFCRKDYSQLVLLAFFLANQIAAQRLLQDPRFLNIRAFHSALFVLNSPMWSRGTTSRRARAQGDARFWNARGAFRPFLERLWDAALAPIRTKENVDRDVRRSAENIERLFLFIPDQEHLALLMDATEGPKDLFAYLESLWLSDLLDEVRVTVERNDGTLVRFTQLSEGEQQLLTVLGLLLFTQDDEALYLLDEPDTHLNPIWTYEYLDLLRQNIRADNGQMIVATHNPLMVGSLYRNEVRVLNTDEQHPRALPPDYDPIGIGIEGLLKSELYGLRSSLAPEIITKLDRQYVLLGKAQRLEVEDVELTQLSAELNELGIARTHPNPYFESFAAAVARRSSPVAIPLSKTDIESQVRLADELLQEIIDEERQDEEGQDE